LALLHPVPLRPQDRRVGDGEGARLPHHRLTTGKGVRTVRTLFP
jgi:hypothetical protein